MSSAEKFDVSTLNWVKGEIDETLKQARLALETYAENSEDANQLQFCITYLHQVAGTLQMVELRGAARFASEIENAALALQQGRSADRDATFDILMRAILQLPDYLESLQAGTADNPLVLLSLLNELRHSRGEKPLNESIFFSPDLSALPKDQPSAAVPNISSLIRKLRPYYQIALLKLIKNEDNDSQLKTIHAVADKLFAAVRVPQVRQWLWILRGYVEILRENSLALSDDLKLILGRNDLLFRALLEHGEKGIKPEHLIVLDRSMLFKIGTANGKGSLSRELREAFHLDQLIPESVKSGHTLLGGFNAELKRTVSTDVLSELTRVKDAFDIFVRSDHSDTSSLSTLADGLTTIAETLVMLREEQLSQLLREQSAVLKQLASGTSAAEDSTLMGVAGAILSVEASLKDWGNVAPVEQADDRTGQLTADEVGLQAESEHQRVVRQVMKEARDSVIKVRESLSQYLESGHDKGLLNAVPQQLHEVIGSLTMLSYRRVSQILTACRLFVVNDLINGGVAPSAEKLDALADAIMSTEYYLEAFVQSRVHPGSVLDVAERGVAELGYAVDSLADREQHSDSSDETEEPLTTVTIGDEAGSGFALPPLHVDVAEQAPPVMSVSPAVAVEASLPPAVKAESVVASAPSVGNEVDDEIIEIFIEEAEEELANIGQLLPKWSDNPADDEALRDLRRSFHTLKGSGRLVGASTLGEFAWAFENMLNRVIDGTIQPGPALFDMLDQAKEALAQLIANFRDGTPLDDEIEMLREGATEMVQPGGMKFAATTAPVTPATPPPAPAATTSVPTTAVTSDSRAERIELEPVLLEIYAKETEGHLAQLEEFLAGYAKGLHRVNEPLIRALHTLTGSSRMAGVLTVSELTTLLEKYAKTIQIERLPMSGEGATLLEGCVAFVKQVMAHLEDGDNNPLPTNSELVARANALYATVQHAEANVSARPEEGLAAKPEEEAPAVAHIAESSAIEGPSLSALPSEESSTVSELTLTEPMLSGDLASEQSLEAAATANDLEKALEILEPSRPEPVETEPRIEVIPQAGPSVAAEPLPADEYDPELMEIFLEEGDDILNASEETLQAWVNNPDDRSLVEMLQRHLHTLKGGARMAGISAIGDLSHSLETTFEAVVEGRLVRSKRMMELLQLAHDRLVEMLEQVRQQRPLSSGDDLIKQIYALGSVESGSAEPAVDSAPALVAENQVVQPAIEVPHAKPSEPEGAALQGDPLEILFARGSEHIATIMDKSVAWRHAPADLEIMQVIREAASQLMNEAGAAVIIELTELAKAVVDLLKAVDDGHVPISEKVFSLLAASGERLNLIFGQLLKRTQLSNGIYLVGNVSELIKSSIAEQRVAAGLSPDEEVAPAPAVSLAAVEKIEPETGADENRRQGARIQHEMVRVRSDLLDNMVNFAGEVSIYRSRVEQQLGSMRFNIDDLNQTVTRLREQVRQFDIETEAQIDSRYHEAVGQDYEDFDPLEFDRFTNMQQLSRSMMESLNDLMSIEDTMLNLSRESETLLLQQSRVNTELQETLMHTRMMPLVEHAPRFRRIVRQTCAELKKEANLSFLGADVEMDRNVVDRILAPLEHMLRNSIAHGIESPQKRIATGKESAGTITVELSREGSEIVIRVSDDGAGINLDAVRNKAIEKGLMTANSNLSNKEIMHFILESGFSTAEALSQIAGRGVGMDVVASEIRQLGGILDIDSVQGKGTKFTIRLPLTLSVSRALLVNAGEEIFAIPLLSITGIERIAKPELEALLEKGYPQYRWVGQDYAVLHLSRVLGITSAPPPQEGDKVSLLLAQSGDNRVALAVDGLVGNREIVVKSLGAQLSSLQDIAGATILADGHVALIIDLPGLIRRGLAKRAESRAELAAPAAAAAPAEWIPTVMVVDDSITVRKVTERLLKRHHMKCITAKDGVDALAVLEDANPDVMLLDIEMPRMDGYELATHIRNSARFRKLPIIMITSRTGEKHRQRAMDIGVNIYMGKPYTEVDLLSNIETLLKLHDE